MEAKRLETALFLAVVISFGVAEECIQTAPCECKTSQMSVNLNTLPSFTAKDKAKGTTYFFSPCKPVQEPGCKAVSAGVAMCQQDGANFYDAGDFKTLKFAGDPAVDNLSLTYTAVSGGVTSDCAPTPLIPISLSTAISGLTRHSPGTSNPQVAVSVKLSGGNPP